MHRRVFLRKSCQACLLTAAGIVLPQFAIPASAKKRKVFRAVCNEQKQVIIPAALFEDSTLQIVSVKDWTYDLAVHSKEDGSFDVFLLKCTHHDNELEITEDGFLCNRHGSMFDKTGAVTEGPAAKPLEQFPAVRSEDQIIITT